MSDPKTIEEWAQFLGIDETGLEVGTRDAIYRLAIAPSTEAKEALAALGLDNIGIARLIAPRLQQAKSEMGVRFLMTLTRAFGLQASHALLMWMAAIDAD